MADSLISLLYLRPSPGRRSINSPERGSRQKGGLEEGEQEGPLREKAHKSLEGQGRAGQGRGSQRGEGVRAVIQSGCVSVSSDSLGVR